MTLDAFTLGTFEGSDDVRRDGVLEGSVEGFIDMLSNASTLGTFEGIDNS